MRISQRRAVLGAAAVLTMSLAACGATQEATGPEVPGSDNGVAAAPELDEVLESDQADAHAAPSPGQPFYVDAGSTPLQWAEENDSDPRAEAIRTEIAGTPMARWFGNWTESHGESAAELTSAAHQQGQLPIMVAYNISGRDACGGHSGGGAGSPEAYSAWISELAGGIGERPALVVLEPDALGDYECMSESQVAEREGMLTGAIDEFAEQAPNTWTYLDAGNAGWVESELMAERLHAAGLENAHGFSLNVSNYRSTEDNTAYGQEINAVLEEQYGYTKPFVIDTSRNGQGPDDADWCNPAGQQIGEPSQWGDEAEMLLWIKTPGESDGDCGVGEGSAAGDFLPDVAYDLVHGP